MSTEQDIAQRASALSADTKVLVSSVQELCADAYKLCTEATRVVAERDSYRATALHYILDRIATQEAEIERLRRIEKLWFEQRAVISSRDEAEDRVHKLEAMLREIGNAYHDNRAGGCPGAGDRLDDAVARIDAALAPPTASGAAGGGR